MLIEKKNFTSLFNNEQDFTNPTLNATISDFERVFNSNSNNSEEGIEYDQLYLIPNKTISNTITDINKIFPKNLIPEVTQKLIIEKIFNEGNLPKPKITNLPYDYKNKEEEKNFLLNKPRKNTNENEEIAFDKLNSCYVNGQEFEETKTNNIEPNNEKKRGRKLKESKEKGEHTKKSPDNLAYKTKSNFLNFILILLNTLINKDYFENPFSIEEDGFYKLQYEKFAKNIKKSFNEKLLQTSIEEIFSSDVSTKYSTRDKKHNVYLIQHLKENPEEQKEVLSVLNLTFGELFDYFRGIKNEKLIEKMKDVDYLSVLGNMKKIEDFIEGEINKEKKNGTDEYEILEYIISLVILIYKYEKFFEIKKGRERKSK